MTTASGSAAVAEADFEDLVDRTRRLSPMLVLGVGDIADGVLQRVNVTKKQTKAGLEIRFYYELRLLKNAKGTDKDKKPFAPNAGDVITVPGTGGLDYTMEGIAEDVTGQKRGTEVDWSKLYGHRFAFERTPDEKMSKGDHAGKDVKCYTVKHSAPKKK